MADGGEPLTVATVDSIAAIGRGAWDSIANPPDRPFNPFVSFDFLNAIEVSRSVSEAAGWRPAHLVLKRGAAIEGAAPLYLKAHSQGEYVFDHHWADAYQRAGGSYYPKLLCAAPFTPVSGPRMLARDSAARDMLASALVEVARQSRVSSVHVNFLLSDDEQALHGAAFLKRSGVQYHWINNGYATFEDFLSDLASRKRKAIRRERRDSTDAGIVIRTLTGRDICEKHWDAFWSFYQDTGARKWGRPYLTRSFFSMVGETMADRILIVMAERDGSPIAGALNFIGSDALFGRYWGCTEHHAFLHFEVCYHQAIEAAIVLGLSRVEAGAQGEHKLARGYVPVETRSAHWIADTGFRAAIARYLENETEQTEAEIHTLSSFTPFRKS